MALVKLKAEIKNKSSYRARVERTRRSLQNRKRPHQDSKNWLVNRWMVNFGTQGTLYGDRWEPLAESTIKYREKLKLAGGVSPAFPILIRQEELLIKDFQRQNEAGDVTMDSTQWSFTNDEPRFLLSHHFGQPQPKGGILPPRKLWDIDGTDKNYIVGAFRVWVMEVLARS